jgi:hypothetical protein
MEALMPQGNGVLEIELLCQDMTGCLTQLASATLDVQELHSASYPLPCALPLIDHRSVQAGVLHLEVEQFSLEAPFHSPSETLLAVPAPAASEFNSSTIEQLEAELRELRMQTTGMERQLDAASVQMRVEHRLRVLSAQDAARQHHDSPSPMTAMLSDADWRTSSILSLDRTISNLSRDSTVAQILEGSRTALASLLSQQAA